MPKEGHWLMSCYACGRQLRYPTKMVRDPLHAGSAVSVCNGACGAWLYRLGIKIERKPADEAGTNNGILTDIKSAVAMAILNGEKPRE